VIDALAHEFWEGTLQEQPIMATLLGDRRFDDAVPDLSPEGIAIQASRLEGLRERVLRLDLASLAVQEHITAKTLLRELDNGLAHIRAGLWEWSVDPLSGVQVDLMTLALLQKVRTAEQADAMLQRWNKLGRFVDQHTENLRRALAAGRVATRVATARVVRQLEELGRTPTELWTLLAPAQEKRPEWSSDESERFARRLREAVESSIRPAFGRYLECVRDEVLPRARDEDRVGLGHVPGGEAAYRALIDVHTSLPLSALEIHEFGLAEARRIREELLALGQRLLGVRTLPAVLEQLRTSAALFFSSREEVRGNAEDSLRRAREAIPRWFGRLPKAECEVQPIEPYEEKDATIAYYRQPAKDGSRPGVYHVNTYAPETRPRYEAQVLAFHESIPGHHLQIAIAQELEGLPEFRKHTGTTAYVEGWALYTERLAEEMGLYSAELDRVGMLSFDAWRACRLVVDTGMHAFGWSRARSIDFMLENTALARNNIENEVDRYVTWPGQALAYKIGQREMMRLRRLAEEELGDRFDIRAFHDRVLENGAVSLPILAEQIEAWIEGQLERPADVAR
jgi:uncharacterized protein (DUF885 family)